MTSAESAPKLKPGAGVRERAEISDRGRAERRLGLLLSAPAVVVMLLVTAYPLASAKPMTSSTPTVITVMTRVVRTVCQNRPSVSAVA
jgi:hypothetical protein